MLSPAVLVVAHATDRPGVDSLVAGVLAEALAGEEASPSLYRFSTAGTGIRVPGGCEHVSRAGVLEPNAMYWLERASSRAETLDHLPEGKLPTRVLLSVNPAVVDPDGVAALRCWSAGRGHWASVMEVAGGFDVMLEALDGHRPLLRHRLARDIFGRLPMPDMADIIPELRQAFHAQPTTTGPTLPRTAARMTAPRIVVVGSPSHLLDVHPATLAALGDAADSLGLAPVVTCVSHDEVAAADWQQILSDADGLVLPGGSDMSQVEAQIAAATAAYEQDLPTLGLCLGMQTMTTAFLRRVCGIADAHLEETAPGASALSFIGIRDARGEIVHYLGERMIAIQPNTRLAALYGGLSAVERLNHRYRLNPALVPRLARHGLEVTAMTPSTEIAQGIEAPGRRFFIGIQGHPELRSRRLAPHCAVLGFLEAVAGRASNQSRNNRLPEP